MPRLTLSQKMCLVAVLCIHLDMLKNMFTMFLFLGLALHLRNMNRSRRSITYMVVLKLHFFLLKKLEPIPENSIDERWRWFKNCLGALDGIYISVHADAGDKSRYRTRKGEIATNVLGVCTSDMQFINVLPSWEGSTTDGGVLRDAISRRNGLKVPQGC
ncbi:hypothetical protein Pint_28010 [Pistacia integerrima]|uniref:Uncharacterized protein n=1 Tax=Pistacia integerrima TaxID=434235 RepID=A0ACC0YR58_9ROSI|nr:hypothetical protein Pint_28010 [Pistacia integerrima]